MFPFHAVPALRRHLDPPAQARPPLTLALAALIALAALSAQAQPAPRSPRPDPLDPQASVPPLRYTSSLQPADRSAAAPPIAWREANDAVARIGGWRVYAREAQQPDPAPDAPPPVGAHSGAPPPALRPTPPAQPPAPPAQPDHRGHRGHTQP